MVPPTLVKKLFVYHVVAVVRSITYPNPVRNRRKMKELVFNAKEENIPNVAVTVNETMRVMRRPIESESPPKT